MRKKIRGEGNENSDHKLQPGRLSSQRNALLGIEGAEL